MNLTVVFGFSICSFTATDRDLAGDEPSFPAPAPKHDRDNPVADEVVFNHVRQRALQLPSGSSSLMGKPKIASNSLPHGMNGSRNASVASWNPCFLHLQAGEREGIPRLARLVQEKRVLASGSAASTAQQSWTKSHGTGSGQLIAYARPA